MRRRGQVDPEQSLAVRAAWLHYIGGLTQTTVAKRLGLPSVKAHRLIAKAQAEGLVKVSIDGDIIECVELEYRLGKRYGLDYCEVAPDLGEDELPLRALGLAGANFLRREIALGEHRVIGLGHGRTMAAMVQHLPRFDAGGVRFVSVLGGLTRNYAANPHDVMHSLAEKTGAQAYVLPVPFFANSEGDRRVLLAQPGVAEIMNLSTGATLKLVGVGSADASAQLVASGMIEPQEIAEIVAAGAAGEMMGHFFDASGRIVETMLSARTLSAPLDDAEDTRVVVIAGGTHKIDAIRAVLNSGRVNGLITDELTAQALFG
ncbi:sugar-binding transcriptional regulator [Paracoccus caeni]|uniref:Sugar-binding transcriptional regulator n=1 Tax=Paracoccus caeni TaxID=657651 RepID=A0A934SGN6_9RHOB|nr:sugar-binding transcriptional regulator [Paracoccus caeni]MBK4217089.1 sugar-binding transcriptional regulator [Paracoccus caeni]